MQIESSPNVTQNGEVCAVILEDMSIRAVHQGFFGSPYHFAADIHSVDLPKDFR